MSENFKTKKIVVKYKLKEKYISELSNFGWKLQNELLLNRFGNPLPLGEKVDQDDLEEKCSYELIFTRDIEPETADKLDKIERELCNIHLFNESFGHGRVTAMVFLSIAIHVFTCFTICDLYYFSTITDYQPSFPFLIFIVISACVGLFFVIKTGITGVKNNVQKNIEIKAKINSLIAECRSLLSDKND